MTSAELGSLLTDDPSTPAANDATVTEVIITPDVSIDDVTVDESAGQAVFTVSLWPAGNHEVTVSYVTVDGTAVAGSDFTNVEGNLSFAPGVTSQPIAVQLLADFEAEPVETFTVVLTNADGARLVDAEGLGTITDQYEVPLLSIDDVSVFEGDEGLPTPVSLSASQLQAAPSK